MAHDHHHDHDDHHDHDHSALPAAPSNEGAASLVKALRLLFVGLRILMVVLVVLLFKTGYFEVKPDEQILAFRFGKLQSDENGNEVFESGQARVYWVWPKPIGNTLSLPSKSTPLTIESSRFWYAEDKSIVKQPGQGGLDSKQPFLLGKEGYVITGDKYVFHVRCVMTYSISDAVQYYRAFYNVDSAKNFDEKASEKNARKIIQSHLDQVVTMESSRWQVDSAFYNRLNDYRAALLARVQKNIEKLAYGITIERIDIKSDDRAPLKQVQGTFNRINQASTEVQSEINKAKKQSSLIRLKASEKGLRLTSEAMVYQKRMLSLLSNLQELDERFAGSTKSDLRYLYQTALTQILTNVEHRYITRDADDIIWLQLGEETNVKNSQNGDEDGASTENK